MFCVSASNFHVPSGPTALTALVYLGIRSHNDSHNDSEQSQRTAEDLNHQNFDCTNARGV